MSFTGGFYAVASAESMQADGIGAMAPVQWFADERQSQDVLPTKHFRHIGTCVHCNCDSSSSHNSRGSTEVSTLSDEMLIECWQSLLGIVDIVHIAKNSHFLHDAVLQESLLLLGLHKRPYLQISSNIINFSCVNMCQYVSICVNMCQYVSICVNMCHVSIYHQISSNIIQYHQISLRIIKYLQISSNIIKYHQISSNIIKYHQISSNIIKYFQISSIIIKYHQISSNIITYHHISSNIIKYHETRL